MNKRNESYDDFDKLTTWYPHPDGALRLGRPTEKQAEAMRNKAVVNLPLQNTSGMIPVEFKVLVEPVEVEKKTAGGIILPKDTIEKEEIAQCKAKLIDVGSAAFTDWGNGRNPRPGDMVLMAKYAGIEAEGIDGKKYRIINDKEITAILTNG